MIPFHDVLTGEQADAPTDDRRNGFDHAEDESGAQGFTKTGLMQAGTFADRRGERIHRHAKSENECSGKIHVK
ncbi:hypothetical protein D3C76_1844620 [compost metagenome]